MDKSGKFLLPSPKFATLDNPSPIIRHFLSPEGIQLLPKEQQPPPMYGPRGSTIPPKFHNPSTVAPKTKTQKFYCNPCEAEFKTSNEYKVHKSEHVQCEIDECEYRGHPEFMDTHIANKHATGLYNELKRLSTPEEIAQWRAERKKNYPTVAIVQQKWKAQEQRMLRGEKLEMQNKKRFGNRADRRPIKGDNPPKDNIENPDSKKRKRNRRNDRHQQEKKRKEEVSPAVPKQEISIEVEVPENGIKMFRGTRGIPGYKVVKKTEATNVLSSLLGMYGSDSEDNSDEDTEKEKTAEENMETKSPEQSTDLETIRTNESGIKDQDITAEKMDERSESEPNQEKLPDDETNDKSDLESTSETEQKGDKGGQEEVILAQSTEGTPTDPCDKESSDDSGPEEVVISKSTSIPDRPQPEPPRKKTKPNPPKRKSGLDYRKLRVPRQNTMLEKLLEADIRHERNVLLQCVRFVVENNFFDKPK